MNKQTVTRQRLFRVGIFVIALWLCYLMGDRYASIRAVKAGVSQPALTAVIREFSERAGRRTLRAEYLEARRADGTVMRTKHVFDGTKQQELSVVLLQRSDGVTVHMVPELKVKSTTFRDAAMRQAEDAGRLDPATNCISMAGSSFLTKGHRLIREERRLGQLTAVVSRGEPGRQTTTFHYAQSLGCYPLLEHTEFFKEDGTIAEFVDKEVVKLTLGEPNVDFSIPADFTEAPPSELRLAVANYIGMAECPSCMKDSLKRQDEVYFRLRPPTY